MQDKPRIYVAYTGGTVGMTREGDGSYRPTPGYLPARMAEIPQFSAPDVPDYTVHEYDPLLDSSDMTPEVWHAIAEDLRAHEADFDGFLVVHGTDTMAYTASALSFMLEGLRKPVVFTGSQIPLCETRSDAQENLLTSLQLLGRYGSRMAEVALCFGDRVLRGNRATKLSTSGFRAFDSPNLPPLGRLGIGIELDWGLVRGPSPEPGELGVRKIGSATVGSFRLFPGLKAEYLDGLLSTPVDGLVLECFGAGNAPVRDEAFLGAIREATARGILVVAVTQPLHGSAALERYVNGRALLDAGVVSGYDMTPEAALAKLLYVLELTSDDGERRALVRTDLRGELSLPQGD